MNNKSIMINFRVNEEDGKVIKDKASKSNKTMSNFVRDSVLEKEICVVDNSKKYLLSIIKINSSLNELIKENPNVDFYEIENEVEKLWSLLKWKIIHMMTWMLAIM